MEVHEDKSTGPDDTDAKADDLHVPGKWFYLAVVIVTNPFPTPLHAPVTMCNVVTLFYLIVL